MVLKIYAFEENWKASINVHTKPLKDGFCPGSFLPFEQKKRKTETVLPLHYYSIETNSKQKKIHTISIQAKTGSKNL